MKQVCLPQGSVATLFTCGRQIQNYHECEVCRAFCIPEIINIILFLDQFAYKTIRISLFWTPVRIWRYITHIMGLQCAANSQLLTVVTWPLGLQCKMLTNAAAWWAALRISHTTQATALTLWNNTGHSERQTYGWTTASCDKHSRYNAYSWVDNSLVW